MQHKTQENGAWVKHGLIFQLANIGSEVIRAINWKAKGNKEYSQLAFERSLELFDLTISDPKNLKRLKEICRAREVTVDFLSEKNEYNTTSKYLIDYFTQFTYFAALKRSAGAVAKEKE